MNFIHMADMHLGYRQYDLEQRFLDFGHTFKKIAEYAIDNKVEFMLISGDLFDKRSINAPTFIQANHVLSMLKEAGIPCIAIEGNHDRSLYKDKMSWLESLDDQGVKLLKVIKNIDGNLMGDYVDVGKIRIFGYGFGGSMTSNAIPQIAREIKAINDGAPPDYTILMMHAGVQGKMKCGMIGEVTYEDLYPLKDSVDYLALGHYHSVYDIDGWVYNPGSPDTCSIAEADEQKGFFHVKDDVAKLIPLKIRKFIVLRIRVDQYKAIEPLRMEIEDKLSNFTKYEKPVITVILEGTLNFDKSHLNTDALRDLIREKTNALYADVQFDLANDEFSISPMDKEGLNRKAIEFEVFRKIAKADSMTADNCDLFARSMADIKDLAAKGADEKTLDDVVRKAFEVLDGVPKSGPVVEIHDKPPIPTIEAPKAIPIKRGRKHLKNDGQTSLNMGDGP